MPSGWSLGARASLFAQRCEREGEQHGVTHHRFEVDTVDVQPVRLSLDRTRLEDLLHVRLECAFDGGQAAPALAHPRPP